MEYKVVQLAGSPAETSDALNALARQGWVVHPGSVTWPKPALLLALLERPLRGAHVAEGGELERTEPERPPANRGALVDAPDDSYMTAGRCVACGRFDTVDGQGLCGAHRRSR